MRSFSRRCVLVLVLFLAAVLGCSLPHYWCREDDPHEQLMDKRIYRREGTIFANNEEEKGVELNSSTVDMKHGSEVKVKASHEDLANMAPDTTGLDLPAGRQKSDFWDALPFRDVSWVENEYDMARGEFYYAKVMMKLDYDKVRLMVNTEIRISEGDVKRERLKNIILHLDQVFENLMIGFCDWDESYMRLVGVTCQ